MSEMTLVRNAPKLDLCVGQVTDVTTVTANGVAVPAGLTPGFLFGGASGISLKYWSHFMGTDCYTLAAGVVVKDAANRAGVPCVKPIDPFTSYAYASNSGEAGANAGFVMDSVIAPTGSTNHFFFYR